ncbi:hypothetical protein DPMN_155933 [Dreissena polymorpha]|uniref:Uncharacterized protein n=1 Tax=Dreissena polymorpha TaxID=45954 RepID=A0A9D4FTG7_DREPO|nr:hypothetical protein DPMN_155933 [Dreissena polymorpha]
MITFHDKINDHMTCPKPNWSNCHKDIYRASLRQLTKPIGCQAICIPERDIEQLRVALTQATAASIPRINPKAKKKKRPPKARGPNIQAAARISKHAWWVRKCDGAPRGDSHPTAVEMNKVKRNLCKAQRKFNAKKRCSDLEDIMNATYDTTFYKLVRQQRSTNRHLTNCLLYEGRKLTSPEEFSVGWAKYFETLATSINDQRYDHFYLKQATEDLNHLQIVFQTSGITIARMSPK